MYQLKILPLEDPLSSLKHHNWHVQTSKWNPTRDRFLWAKAHLVCPSIIHCIPSVQQTMVTNNQCDADVT